MAPEEIKSDVRAADFVFAWGRWSDLDSLAQRLFAGLDDATIRNPENNWGKPASGRMGTL